MRLAVALVTAMILIVVGALDLLIMLPGMNVYGASTWTIILIGSSVLVLIAIVISSVVSGLLAHAIQTRSGISPWVVGPLTIVAVTAVAIVAMFLGISILSSIIGAVRHPAPPLPQPPAANRRGGGR
ncbi:MAG TPA: hypothetical protein VF611_10250 [Pyrinomonadaceae bacterium]|jgi:hypothetical protein